MAQKLNRTVVLSVISLAVCSASLMLQLGIPRLAPTSVEVSLRFKEGESSRWQRVHLKNEGWLSTRITRVDTTCGCVKPEVSSKRIQGGESYDLNLLISAPESGSRETLVIVRYGWLIESVSAVKVVSHSPKEAYSHPANFLLENAGKDGLPNSQTRNVFFLSTSRFELGQLRVRTPANFLATSLKKAIGGVDVTVSVREACPIGQLRVPLELYDVETKKVIWNSLVCGHREGNFEAKPATLPIYDNGSHLIEVEQTDDMHVPFRIEEVNLYGSDEASATIELASGPKARIKIDASRCEKHIDGYVLAKIRCNTSDQIATLSIPLLVRLK